MRVFGLGELFAKVREEIPGRFFQQHVTRIGVKEKGIRINPDFVVGQK
jgi:hypothetical protein